MSKIEQLGKIFREFFLAFTSTKKGLFIASVSIGAVPLLWMGLVCLFPMTVFLGTLLVMMFILCSILAYFFIQSYRYEKTEDEKLKRELRERYFK